MTMMDTSAYAVRLEEKLINEFRTKFYDKLGYHPIVVTQIFEADGEDNALPILPLSAMKDYFNASISTLYKRNLSIDTPRRYKFIVELRAIYCTFARKMGYNLTEIATSLKKRDHTTVMYNLDLCQKLLTTDASFKRMYNNMLKGVQTLKI